MTFGTTLVSGGVTACAVNAAGSGYTSAPTVTIPAPSLSVTGTLTSGQTSCTGISPSSAGLHPGMTVLGSGPNPNQIASVVSTSAITLTQPATNHGSTNLTMIGKQALATATFSGGSVTGFVVFVPGTGYSGTVTPTVSGGGGSGATFHAATISNVIAYIPVTSSNSNLTGPPAITITDGTGTGAVAVPVMSGIQPSDVVTYTASDGWLTTAAGLAPAAPSVYSTGSVANYVGQLEPALGGFLGFDLPAGQKTFQLGYNVANPFAAQYFPFYPGATG